MNATIQQAMSEVLSALGFEAMAAAVLDETETERLARYARVCVKNSPAAQKQRLASLFRMCKPALM